MKNHYVAIGLAFAMVWCCPTADAQSISPTWDAYRQKQRTQQTPAPAQEQGAPAPAGQPQGGNYTPPAAQPAYVPPAYRQPDTRNRSGFSLGAQGGRGWVYEDVDQRALAVSAGYRWRAGPVALVGVELSSGRLDETSDRGDTFPEVRYDGIGANARFSFGVGNPWHGIARLGYWSADVKDGEGYTDTVDGAYASAGIGVDFNRHINASLVYTSYAWATSYYYGTEIDQADMVTFGLEVRF